MAWARKGDGTKGVGQVLPLNLTEHDITLACLIKSREEKDCICFLQRQRILQEGKTEVDEKERR